MSHKPHNRTIQKNYGWSENSMIMEYQNIINLLDNTSNQPSKIRTKIGVKINDDEPNIYNIKTIVKLNFRLWCEDQVYVIIVMHIYLLKELYQWQIQHSKMQMQIVTITK